MKAMNKYIDADKLKAMLSKEYAEYIEKGKDNPIYQYMADGIDVADTIVDYILQEQSKVNYIAP